MNFGFIGSPVITMFHQVIYGEIVTIALKLMGEVFVVYLNTVSFFLRVSFQCVKSQTETFAQRVFLVFCVYSSEKTISSVTTYGVQ